MPRIAIKDYDTSFFHVMVQGIRKEYIFNTSEDKRTYQRILYNYLEKYNVKILAYCIMSNHAHILIYIEKIKDMSDYMKAVNTTYALYYNKTYKKVGYVFRNRYKAEPIYSQKYLINCIHYIHDNPIKAQICKIKEDYKFSSYYEYKYNQGKIIKKSKERFKEINDLFIENIHDNCEMDYGYMDYEEEKEFLDKKSVIEKFIKDKKIERDEIVLKNEYLKELSKKLYYECGMSHRDIATEFGTNKTRITRLINS